MLAISLLLVIFPFVLFGHSDYFDFGFTTLSQSKCTFTEKFLNTYLYNREKCPERSGRYQASLRQDAMYEKMSRLSAGFLNLLTICLE